MRPSGNTLAVGDECAIVIALLLLSVAIRLIHFPGISAPDDYEYCRLANDVLTGRYMSGDIDWYSFRPAIFAPVAILFALFGIHSWAACLWPLLASTATLALLYVLVRRFGGLASGIIAVLLCATSPAFAHWGSVLRPDAIATFFLLAAGVAMIKALDCASHRRATILLLSGGVMAFGAHLTRAIGIPLYGLFWLVFVLSRPRQWRLLLPWLAIAAGLMAESAWYAVYNGHPLARLQVLQAFYGQQILPLQPGFYAGLMARDLVRLQTIQPRLVIAGIMIAALFIAKRYRRAPVLLAVWLLVWWLYLEFGSQSLTAYRPMFKEQRFVLLLLPLFYGLCGWLLGTLGFRLRGSWLRTRRVVVLGITAWLVIAGVFLAAQASPPPRALVRIGHARIRSHTAMYRRAAKAASNAPGRWICVSNARWRRALDFYLRYPSLAIDPTDATKGRTRRVVLLANLPVGGREDATMILSADDKQNANPPAHWRELHRDPSFAVYDIGSRPKDTE